MAVIVILVCQAYILCNTGLNISITLKHFFVAILLAAFLSLAGPLLYYEKHNIFYVIPANYCFLTLLPLLINFGFLLKENEQTFPIFYELLSNPCSLVQPLNQEVQMYPSWLEMYPVDE